MIYVALVEAVGLGVCLWLLFRALEAVMASEAQMRRELLAVLGKTDVVSVALSDQRPRGTVTYVDDKRMAEMDHAS